MPHCWFEGGEGVAAYSGSSCGKDGQERGFTRVRVPAGGQGVMLSSVNYNIQ